MTCTFIDAGVLIAAARGEDVAASNALAVLSAPNREFASSIFLKMEVLPKAIYNQKTKEVKFYQAFFDSVVYWATDFERMIQNAYQEASVSGLGTLDALHVAAAVSVGAEEFITNEKPQQSIYRTQSIRIISVRPGGNSQSPSG